MVDGLAHYAEKVGDTQQNVRIQIMGQIDQFEYYWYLIGILNDITVNHIRLSLNKFPDFFHMGTFIDITHVKV